jgi:hypothetical protein
MGARLAMAAGSLGLRVWAKAARRPVDTFAVFTASAATLIIVVNAVFLQSGVGPAPYVVNPAPQQPATAENHVRPAPVPAAKTADVRSTPHPTSSTRAPQAAATRRNDLIAELIGPSSRIASVQRVLSDFGYGQIKPSGFLDEPTSAAIEKFERERKLPVTGLVSDRLVSELGVMLGHPLD